MRDRLMDAVTHNWTTVRWREFKQRRKGVRLVRGSCQMWRANSCKRHRLEATYTLCLLCREGNSRTAIPHADFSPTNPGRQHWWQASLLWISQQPILGQELPCKLSRRLLVYRRMQVGTSNALLDLKYNSSCGACEGSMCEFYDSSMKSLNRNSRCRFLFIKPIRMQLTLMSWHRRGRVGKAEKNLMVWQKKRTRICRSAHSMTLKLSWRARVT